MFKILAIDPSSNFVGIAILTIDSATFNLIDIETLHLNLKIVTNLNDDYTDLFTRMTRLKQHTRDLIESYDIRAIAYERGFADRSKPGAFEPLVTCTTTMAMEFIEQIPLIRIDVFSPGAVKNAMGEKGNCKKEQMKEACLRNETINKFVKPNEITEHEIDAIAVGLCWVKTYGSQKSTLF
jgi:Holliday junction resolvasome RuvABC endonuclease subunit